MSLLRSALGAVSKVLGLAREERGRPEAGDVPEHVRAQRERAARARQRPRSRAARAWVVFRAGFLMEHGGRMDQGQRSALRLRLRRALRRSRLLGDSLAGRAVEAEAAGRLRRGGPKPTGCRKRRGRAARLAAWRGEGA